MKLALSFGKDLRTFIINTLIAYLLMGELQTRGGSWKGEQMRKDILIR